MRPLKTTGKLANRLAILLLLATGMLANWHTVAFAAWGATVPNPIMEYQYTYDNNGNITNIYNAVTVSTNTFTYDEVNRLTQATGPYGVNNAQVTQTYSYDAVGNTVDITPPVTYTYDNGNIIDYNGKLIDYDYENRPVKITNSNNNTITEFAYDYSGQRVYTKVSSGTITSEDYYVGNIYKESYSVDSSSPIISASTTTVTYIYAGSIRVAGLTTQTTIDGTKSDTLYYHGDHLGSSSIITDGSGTVVRNISYQPWGNEQSNTEESGASTLDPNHKFTGQILDDSTGLYYYGARYYDPVLRRFITPDSIVENPYDPQTLNRYAYCRNNPLIYVDPLGLWRISINLHLGFGGHLYYDSDTGHFRGGLGVGIGGGVYVGDKNWDVGFSDDKYIDIGYDNKMKDAYITASYGSGIQGSNGEAMNGWGISGTYYLGHDEYQVGGGVGISGAGVNAGYSSFGDGSWSLGGSFKQVGATYDFGAKKWGYSYTIDPKAMQNAYEEGKANRKYNGYGPEGYEGVFKVIDWLGTVMSGYKASDVHDTGYRKPGSSKAATDIGLLTNMASGAISNVVQTNGILRAGVGLALSPVYYLAVSFGGGPAYKAGQRGPAH